MLDGINPQAAAFTANQFLGQTDQSETVTPNSEHEEKVTDVRKVRTLPGQKEVGPDGRKRDSLELTQEAEDIRQLQMRDREVRAHEAAHAASGGAYAGSPSYTFERGPDGQSYAVGGEVSIDISAIPGDPQATLQKAQQVRAAALAPAEPSGQDMKVAQRAQAMAAKARGEIASERSEELASIGEEIADVGEEHSQESDNSSVSAPAEQKQPSVNPQPTSDISSGFERLTSYA